MTDNINPEYQHPPQDDELILPPPTKPAKKGNGLAFLALVVGAVAAGIGAYNALQIQKRTYDYADGQENPRLAQLEVAVQHQSAAQQNFATHTEVTKLQQEMAVLQQNATNQGVNKADLEKMISQAIAASQLTPEQVAQMAGGVKKPEVEALIQQALTKMAENGNKIDLSAELAKMKDSEEAAEAAATKAEQSAQHLKQQLADKTQQAINAMTSQAKDVEDDLTAKLAQLKQAAGEIRTNAINPTPLLNALKLAEIAAENGNLVGAANYLTQASQSFALFGLQDSAYGSFQEAVTKLREKYAALAKEPSPAAQLNAVMATVAHWPIKNVDPVQKIAPPAPDVKGKTWVETLKGVGKVVLENTVRVTPLDEAGLVWIHANEALQNVIRENTRLDLAFARNALQLGDKSSYAAIVQQTQKAIHRYFDLNNADVAAALALLAKLQDAPVYGADIHDIIQSIDKAQ